MTRNLSKDTFNKAVNAQRKSSSTEGRLAVVETKLESLGNVLVRLEDAITNIKDNHLHDLSLAVTKLQLSVDSIKDCKEAISTIEKRLLAQDVSLKTASDFRKFAIAAAIILLPASINAVVEALKNFLRWGH